MSGLRIVAAILIVASGVVLFTTDDLKLFAIPLIVGNLLALWDDRRGRQS
ncbi:MAG TPA: hypothetical protein VEU30_01560 [Thermoanaerobaculia bacterium]|nr:hypothetical protein [Thermoanaerobaculia bacterium]